MSLQSDDLNLKILFGRAFIFFLDEINESLYNYFATYASRNSYVPQIKMSGDKTIFFLSTYQIEKLSWNQNGLKKFINETVKNIDLDMMIDLVNKHMEIFANFTHWQKHVIDRYRHSDIVATNQEIAELCTIENLKLTQQNLKIELYKTKPSDERWLN